MRWKIGNFEFDTVTRRLGNSSAKLSQSEAKLLEFLIREYDRGYGPGGCTSYNEKIIRGVWPEGKGSEDSLYTSIKRIRDAFGGELEDYVAKSPYRLVVKPEPLIDEILPAAVEPSNSEQQNTSLSREKTDFALIVDGMIISSVAELLLDDPRTASIRKTCSSSYLHCLEDLAFATVYASRIITGKEFRPRPNTSFDPWQELMSRLEEICDQVPYPANVANGSLLYDNGAKNLIRDDIVTFARCVADARNARFFRDYMAREATKHLGTDGTLFQEDLDRDRYRFDVQRSYYTDAPLQDALGAEATAILVGYLPKTPPAGDEPFAANALREFATRNVLSLITIMWESDRFGKSARAWRLPHILRVLVAKRRPRNLTQQQELLRDWAVQQALAAALRNVRASSRENLIPALLNLREEKPFKQIRERLNQAHLMVVEASPQREADARRVLRELTALFDRIVTQPDRVALENGAVHRSLSVTKAPAYEADLYGVFPELRRIDNF